VHFGSRHPGEGKTIFEFFPSAMFSKVRNRDHFMGALIFDKWVSNADGRQAIFCRDTNERGASNSNEWIASMIDNGNAFQGTDWILRHSDRQGLYCRAEIYGEPIKISDFNPWIECLMRIRPEIKEELFHLIPSTWFEGDEPDLRHLLDRIFRRREDLPSLLRQSVSFMNHMSIGSFRPVAKCGSGHRASYVPEMSLHFRPVEMIAPKLIPSRLL
jgi:hypothetical protein